MTSLLYHFQQMLLFWDLRESGSAKFYSPVNWGVKNGRGPRGTGSSDSPWHP